jgi:hypothetical protein
MQFINLACVVLLVNFSSAYFEDKANEKQWFQRMLPILVGDYTDFSAQWYKQVGKTLCITLFINVFSPYPQRFFWPALAWIRRLYDRGSC